MLPIYEREQDSNMKTLYVVDASGYLYRSYFAIRNMTNAKGESTNALFGFIRSIQKLIKDFQPDYLVAVFDGPRNIIKREAIYPQYKAHRSGMPGDLRYQIEWAHTYCNLMGIPQLNISEAEADDVMGSIAKWAAEEGALTYLCSGDKDMCQLVNDRVFIINTHKENQLIDREGVEKIHGVPPEKMIDLLAIIGDSSDNVPGLSGFGPKTAAELIQKFGSLDYILAHPDEVPGKKKQETLTEERDQALISRQLITIDTEVDIPKEWAFFTSTQPNVVALKEFFASMRFNSLIKELDQELLPAASNEQLNYYLVDDEATFKELLTFLSAQKEICVDTETTDVRPLRAELVGIGLGVEPHQAWYVPTNGQLGLKRVLEGLKPLFLNPQIGFYGHNIKYDLHVLHNHGIQVANISFDTLLASYLLNSHNRQHSLDTLALEYFGKVKTPISDLIGKGKKQISMREVPIDQVCSYCCEDVDYTCRLKQVLELQLSERKLDKLFYDLELPLLPILADMERRGIYLDVPHLKQMSTSIVQEIADLQKDIFELAGVEFNLNSPMQLQKILFDKLRIPYPKKTTGNLSTAEAILESLKTDYLIIAKILEYRKLEKLRSTYVDALPGEINPRTHRIHCTFNQSVAATGRLSCQEPNLQNIPIRSPVGSKIRESFWPQQPNWSYLSGDYSQIELRLLAHLSQDPNLIEAFLNYEDIHAHTAAAIYNIPLSAVTKEQRYSAKAVNFGIIYGQQAFGLAQTLNISNAEAATFITTYFKRFKQVKEFIQQCKEQARQTGKAVTFTGRERQIPEINSKNAMLRNQAERLAVNTPIQGAAADMIKMAMLAIADQLVQQQLEGYMILQIHDELIFEVPDIELPLFKAFVKEVMEQILNLNVPLVVDISIGKNWKEC
jgi:DNA polymerase-1